MAAITRLTAHKTLLQMQALRVAAWGDVGDMERFRGALTGNTPDAGRDDTDAALAAFGLRLET